MAWRRLRQACECQLLIDSRWGSVQCGPAATLTQAEAVACLSSALWNIPEVSSNALTWWVWMHSHMQHMPRTVKTSPSTSSLQLSDHSELFRFVRCSGSCLRCEPLFGWLRVSTCCVNFSVLPAELAMAWLSHALHTEHSEVNPRSIHTAVLQVLAVVSSCTGL